MSTLQVENLIGPTSGSNANKVIIPSGQTLDASNGFVAPAGSVINVVTFQSQGNTVVSSSSFASTHLTISYTPKKAGNTIIIQSNMGADTNADDRGLKHTVFRDSTDLGSSNGTDGSSGMIKSHAERLFTNGNVIAVDENVTSSARTYAIKTRSTGGNSVESDGTNSKKTMIITEIAQ